MRKLINKQVYFDVNLFIYALEPTEDMQHYFSKVEQLFAMAESKQLLALTSELSLTEALVGAFKNNQPLVDLYDAVISPRDDLAVHVINRAILKTAAQLRSDQNIALADAIHIATALNNQADFFITQDKRLQTPTNLQKLTLDVLQEI